MARGVAIPIPTGAKHGRCMGLEASDSFALRHGSSELTMALKNIAVTISKFRLKSGIKLLRVPVVFKTWGTLNARCDNVMVICHPFTGIVDVDEWWEKLFGKGKAFDPTVFFVVCMNVLVSPFGTASPMSIEPSTGTQYGPDFPSTNVRLHKLVLGCLGVSSVAVVIGGSMGGDYHARVAALFSRLCETYHPDSDCIAWGGTALGHLRDAACDDGYYDYAHQPTSVLATARMAGLLTYRSRDSYEELFGCMLSPPLAAARPIFSAQSYLRCKGATFAAKFDANCYIHITHKMDTHDITRGRLPRGVDTEAAALAMVLGTLPPNALAIGIDTDGLCLPVEQRVIADGIPGAERVVIESFAGHDGFLVEGERINTIVVGYLRRELAQLYDDVEVVA
ncbi:Alpha/Beta hydrolase protein [Mycena galericulata]|nr:Alpha/Beta hydrolase protein [Mycena galericulata]